MEKLDSDSKMQVLMNLTGTEIVRLCQTSKSMLDICNRERYLPLWKKKIKEEFNVDYEGNAGFEEYKFLTKLAKKTIYLVTELFEEGNMQQGNILFYTLEASIEYIAEEILEGETEDNYFRKERIKFLKETGELEDFLRVNNTNLKEYLKSRSKEEIIEEIIDDVKNKIKQQSQYRDKPYLTRINLRNSSRYFEIYAESINF